MKISSFQKVTKTKKYQRMNRNFFIKNQQVLEPKMHHKNHKYQQPKSLKKKIQ